MEKSKKVAYGDLIYIINEEEKTASVVGFKNSDSNIHIPRYIFVNSNSYAVTSIADRTFVYSDIESIHISENSEIRSIGNDVFFESSVESLELPSDISDLKEDWNNGIYFLMQIKVIEKAEKNIKLIDDKFLVGKTDSKSDTFDILLLAIRDIESITIPSYIKHIGSSAFQNCQKIKEIKIEENSKIETIDKSAFNNASINSIEIPSSLTSLKKFWNYGLNDGIEIKIIKNDEENIKFVDQTFLVGKSDRKSDIFDILYLVSFSGEEITIPSYIKRIETYAFSNCRQLKKVTFLDDSELESIGEYSFFSTQIECFIVPSHVKEICNSAFSSCKNLHHIKFKENSEIESIGSEVFYNSIIEYIEIPSNIKELKEDWCLEAGSLNRIKVIENDEKNIKIIENNFLVGKSDLKSDIFDVILFAPRDIEEATIPRSIKQIGSSSFNNCRRLRSIKFEANSSLEKICRNAFFQSSIESISIPSSVTEICEYSLSSLNLSLIEFKEDSKLKIMENDCFYTIACEEISIPSHVKEIPKGLFSFNPNIRRIKLHKNSELHSICKDAFMMSAVESIEIPSSVVELKEDWCAKMKSLKEIKVIKNDVENIKFCDGFLFGKTDLKSDVFDVIYLALSSIEKAFIHKNIKKIASSAFELCYDLRFISFQENSQLQTIETHAFNCSPISSISLPPKVTEIDCYAFSSCDNLKIIEFLSKSSFDLNKDCLTFCIDDAIVMVSCSCDDIN